MMLYIRTKFHEHRRSSNNIFFYCEFQRGTTQPLNPSREIGIHVSFLFLCQDHESKFAKKNGTKIVGNPKNWAKGSNMDITVRKKGGNRIITLMHCFI